jgi:hypothetical protein
MVSTGLFQHPSVLNNFYVECLLNKLLYLYLYIENNNFCCLEMQMTDDLNYDENCIEYTFNYLHIDYLVCSLLTDLLIHLSY